MSRALGPLSPGVLYPLPALECSVEYIGRWPLKGITLPDSDGEHLYRPGAGQICWPAGVGSPPTPTHPRTRTPPPPGTQNPAKIGRTHQKIFRPGLRSGKNFTHGTPQPRAFSLSGGGTSCNTHIIPKNPGENFP